MVQALIEDVINNQSAELPATFDVAPGQVHHLSVDFGRIVAGFVELDVEAPAGTVVEMHYREKVFRPELGLEGRSRPGNGRALRRGGGR